MGRPVSNPLDETTALLRGLERSSAPPSAPRTPLAGGAVFGGRIRGAGESEDIQVGGVPIEVTLSVGVAEWTAEMRSPKT